MKTVQHTFTNGDGHQLSAFLDLPPLRKPIGYALFAHCFTCNKELLAVRNIARALTEEGIGVFRFDFPGLGKSEGCFSGSTFSSNVDDLYRAAVYLEEIAESPQILIGHSLGGAAAIRAAALIKSLKGVATIGAPADPAHVTHLFGDEREEIESKGSATVSIAKSEFLIKSEFIEDLESISMEEATQNLGRELLVFHSPVDRVVGIENAATIYGRARHPKSFISLDDADHLLSREKDSQYVGKCIATWASRYLDPVDRAIDAEEVVVRIGNCGFRTDVLANGRAFIADEPINVGGTNLGPTPYDFLSAGLGACTAMTLRMYADRKDWPLESVEVHLVHDKIHARDCDECVTSEGRVDVIERRIILEGNLDEAQKSRLLEIADRCPVHRTLESEVRVETVLFEG